MKSKQISLSNKEYFNLGIGKRVVKKDIKNSKGDIPIFSANVFTPIGFSEESNLKSFNNPRILWGIDGNFEFNIKYAGENFASTDHCGTIEILDKSINPNYLLYALNKIRSHYGFDRNLRASLKNMKTIEVELPLNDKGEIDVTQQKKIAKVYNTIRDLRSEIANMYEDINTSEVELETDFKTEEVALSDNTLFNIDNGKRIRKKDINKARGDIPVYSASKYKTEALGCVSDKIKEVVPDAKKFSGKFLTINADGSVGKVFLREGVFYANDIVNVIKILDPNILEEYLQYELEREIMALGYNSWSNKLYKEKLKSIKVKMPINKKGEFDIAKQKEIAHKFDTIHEIKDKITAEFEEIMSNSVDIAEI